MEEFTAVIFGLTLRYLAAGSAGDPAVLYIHGNLGSAVWYEKVMEVPGRRTVALDMPNFGMSEASGDFSMAGYARFVAGFIDEVLGAEECVVVGHSLGGVVAMELAASRPDLIERLMLVSPGPIEGLKTPQSHYPAIERYRTDRAFLKTGLRAVAPYLRDEDFLDRITDMAARMDSGAFLGHPKALDDADFRGRLGALPFPTMLLRGNADIIITEDMALRTAEHLGADFVAMPECGHSPMAERPDEFLRVLAAFLEKES